MMHMTPQTKYTGNQEDVVSGPRSVQSTKGAYATQPLKNWTLLSSYDSSGVLIIGVGEAQIVYYLCLFQDTHFPATLTPEL